MKEQTGKCWLATPLEVRNAKYRDRIPPTRKSIVFDGILAWGMTFEIVNVEDKFQFHRTLAIHKRSGVYFKGVSKLEKVRTILQIKLGISTSGIPLSLLLLPAAVTFACPEGAKYTQLLKMVYEAQSYAFGKLELYKRSRRCFITNLTEYPNVFRADVVDFAAHLNLCFTNMFGKDGFVFAMWRMGQDQIVGSDETGTGLSPESANVIRSISRQYSEFNLKAISYISFHVARDQYPPTGEVFLWNLKAISNQIGKPNEVYHPFFLPGKGNASYTWAYDENLSPIKHLNFYLRCGHQVHRNPDRYFVDFKISKGLVKLYGVLLRSGKKKFNETKGDRDLLYGRMFNMVEACVTELGLCPPIRCETVFGIDLTNSDGFTLSLYHYMKLAVDTCMDYMEVWDFHDPSLYVSIPSAILEAWVLKYLNPCIGTIQKFSYELDKALNKKRPQRNQNEREESVMVNGVEPSMFLNIALSECLIGFVLRGCLPAGTPKFIERYLGFSDIENSLMGKGALKNVEFLKDKVEVRIHPAKISLFLGSWLGVDDLEYMGLLTFATEFSRSANKCTDETLDDLREFSISFCNSLCQYRLSDEERAENVSGTVDVVGMNLERLKEVYKDSHNTRKVYSTDEFVNLIHTGKGFHPAPLSTLFMAFSNIVALNTNISTTFSQATSKHISDQILQQGTPLFFTTSDRTDSVILPHPSTLSTTRMDYEDIATVFADGLTWLHGSSIGKVGKSAIEFFGASIIEVARHGNNIPLSKYFRLIKYCLDNESVEMGVNTIFDEDTQARGKYSQLIESLGTS